MDRETKDEVIVRRYLLGELSQGEQEQFEQRLMTDSDCFHLASVMEEELVDKYLSDDLLSDERERFSRRFLSTPEGSEQLKLAANLRRYARRSKINPELQSPATDTVTPPSGTLPIRRSGFSTARFALATAAVLITVILVVLALRVWRLQNQIESLQAREQSPGLREQELQNQIAEQQARNDELASSLRREQEERAKLEQEVIGMSGSRPDRAQPLIAAITLTPGRSRGGGQSKQLVIKSGMSQVLLHLLVREPAYASYRASLQNESGEEIWTSGSLKSQTEGGRIAIRLSIAARLLPGGDYRLRLSGRTDNGDYEDAGSYYFRVARG